MQPPKPYTTPYTRYQHTNIYPGIHLTGIKTLEILSRPGSYEHLDKITSKVRRSARARAAGCMCPRGEARGEGSITVWGAYFVRASVWVAGAARRGPGEGDRGDFEVISRRCATWAPVVASGTRAKCSQS